MVFNLDQSKFYMLVGKTQGTRKETWLSSGTCERALIIPADMKLKIGKQSDVAS